MNSGDPDSTPAVVAEVVRGIGAPCRNCGRPVCGHEVLMSLVLGFKGAPRCLHCLASGLDREPFGFASEVRDHIDHRECWRAGWQRADELEPAGASHARVCVLHDSKRPASPRDSARVPADHDRFDAEWDAGDLGCGDLVLELRLKLGLLNSGQVLKLTARDPGAPQDLPAWCGLTGHSLLRASHPTYFIQRRKE